jgi:hypothetical protein
MHEYEPNKRDSKKKKKKDEEIQPIPNVLAQFI